MSIAVFDIWLFCENAGRSRARSTEKRRNLRPQQGEYHSRNESNVSIKYLGVKIILAIAMTREAFEALHGRNVGGDIHGEGYEVEYENGYKAWSPKDVFDAAYRPVSGLTFGLAIEALKLGKKVARAGWNGKGMWLTLSCSSSKIVKAEDIWAPHNREFAIANGGEVQVDPYITMKTAQNTIQSGWLASQADMLAEDWQVVA